MYHIVPNIILQYVSIHMNGKAEAVENQAGDFSIAIFKNHIT